MRKYTSPFLWVKLQSHVVKNVDTWGVEELRLVTQSITVILPTSPIAMDPTDLCLLSELPPPLASMMKHSLDFHPIPQAHPIQSPLPVQLLQDSVGNTQDLIPHTLFFNIYGLPS